MSNPGPLDSGVCPTCMNSSFSGSVYRTAAVMPPEPPLLHCSCAGCEAEELSVVERYARQQNRKIIFLCLTLLISLIGNFIHLVAHHNPATPPPPLSAGDSEILLISGE